MSYGLNSIIENATNQNKRNRIKNNLINAEGRISGLTPAEVRKAMKNNPRLAAALSVVPKVFPEKGPGGPPVVQSVLDKANQIDSTNLVESLSGLLDSEKRGSSISSQSNILADASGSAFPKNENVIGFMDGGLMALSPQARMNQGLMQFYPPVQRMMNGGDIVLPSTLNIKETLGDLSNNPDARRRYIASQLPPEKKSLLYQLNPKEIDSIFGGDIVDISDNIFDKIRNDKNPGLQRFTDYNVSGDLITSEIEDQKSFIDYLTPSANANEVLINEQPSLEGIEEGVSINDAINNYLKNVSKETSDTNDETDIQINPNPATALGEKNKSIATALG